MVVLFFGKPLYVSPLSFAGTFSFKVYVTGSNSKAPAGPVLPQKRFFEIISFVVQRSIGSREVRSRLKSNLMFATFAGILMSLVRPSSLTWQTIIRAKQSSLTRTSRRVARYARASVAALPPRPLTTIERWSSIIYPQEREDTKKRMVSRIVSGSSD